MATPVLSTRLVNYTGTDEQVDAFAQNAVVVCTNASANTIDIPDESVVNFPIGTIITFVQGGAGTTTVTCDGSANLRIDSPSTAALAGQYSVAQAVKIASDEWVLFGNLV